MVEPARPEPRLLTWLLGAFAALILVFAAYPDVVFAGKTLLVGPGMPGVLHDTTPAGAPLVTPPVMDTVPAYIDEPLARLMGNQLTHGTLPLWNPWNGFGAPLLGNMQSAPLSPFRWLSMFWPDRIALHDLALLLRIGVAAYFTFLFVRGRGAAMHAALAAAATFSLCGYFTLHVSMHHLGVEVWLPALLCAIDACGLDKRVRPTSFLALFLVAFLVTVGGNPESSLVVFLFAACFCLSQLRVFTMRRLAWILVATVLGMGAGAPYLLTALEYLAHSAHHHADTTGLDHYRSGVALSYLRPLVFPTARGGVHPMAPPYVGTSVVILAVVGAFARGTRLPRRFAVITALFCVLKFTGVPLLNDVGRLPGLSMLIFYKYGNPALACALAILVASALSGEPTWRTRHAAWAPFAVLALVGVGWIAVEARATRLELPQFAHPALGMDFVDLCALLLVALAWLWHGSPRARALAPWLATFVCVSELATSAHLERPDRIDALQERPYVAFLRDRLERDRHERADLPRVFGPYSAFPPNVNAAFEMPDVRSHDGLYVERYDRFVQAFLIATNFGPQFDGREMLPMPRDVVLHASRESAFFLDRGIDRVRLQRFLDRPFRELQGVPDAPDLVGVRVDLARESDVRGFEQAAVRYHVWSPGVGLLPEALVLATAHAERWRIVHPDWLNDVEVETATPAAFAAIEERLRRERDAIVLEDVFALPRVQVVSEAVFVADESAAVARLQDDAFPWRERIVVEGDGVDSIGGGSRGEVLALAYGAENVRVRVQLDAPGWLVLRDVPYPGWEVTVDGQPRTMRTANVAFRAVQLEAGTHDVAFEYEAPSFWRGVWIAALACFLALVGALWCWRWGRPTMPPVPRTQPGAPSS